jgi:hypothetical protein
MTEQQTALRGSDAQLVLDNPAFQEAMESLKAKIVIDWRSCPIRDVEGQQIYLQLAKLADVFEGTLVGIINRGKISERKIEIDAVRNESPVRKFMRKVA